MAHIRFPRVLPGATRPTGWRLALLAVLVILSVALPCWSQPSPDIFSYIRTSWDTLERSNRQLLEAARDPKLGQRDRWPVYISRKEDPARVRAELEGLMPPADFAQIELLVLPEKPEDRKVHGLLYLPHPYVVPGGRFNEMYGWDSYFIVLGLLRDGQTLKARHMVENFLYEIEHYGHILNANRTYYLTRSQPPFLSHMVLAVYEKTGDRQWLEAALPAMQRDYEFWTSEPHLVPETGLSRYWDLGEGPAAEVLEGERDEQGRTHYDRIQEYFRTHQVDDYDLAQYYDRKLDRLTPLFYKGDRSMRESGFDPSNRFGAFNLDVIHYNPVDLNTLLWMAEKNTARALEILGRAPEARTWTERAGKRRDLVLRYCWDPATGLFLDYNYQTRARRKYDFATTFFPLWAGLATQEQAARVTANLALFEKPGGLVTSTFASGNQWDSPFGWAPLQMVGIEGLRIYGYGAEADRLSLAFLSLVLKEFRTSGTLVEKYDVVHRTSRVSEGIQFGYSTNEIGFGWTNAVFTRLYDRLPEAQKEALLR